MLRALVGAIALLCFAAIATPSGAAEDEIVDKVIASLAPLTFPSQPPQLSTDCRTSMIAGDRFRKPLRGLRRALREKREPRVLAMGSSSTAGVGASAPAHTYIAQLEAGLERTFNGLDFDVVGQGMSGEVAEGASARMKDTVLRVKPDLVLWQVGTNDAIRHVDLETFKGCLRRTLAWLKHNRYDVVLVDPQYSDELTKDGFYAQTVAAVAEVAHEAGVLLVDRFDAMKELSRSRGDRFYLTSDNLHLNDTGHRCMAEQLARAIVAGVLLADRDQVGANH
jgi:acyl-CoA thioesterase I